jgi:hypothetical protein
LFGADTPAQWPKAFTAAAGEDKRVYRIGHVRCKMGGIFRVPKIAVSFSQTRRIW